jgi:chromosomal replication initiation ATPase DnaA
MKKLLTNKIAILKKKLESTAINVPEDVIVFIAQNTKTDELVEALIHVLVYSIVTEGPVTLDLAEKALNSPKYFLAIKRLSEKKVVQDTKKQENIHKAYGRHLN